MADAGGQEPRIGRRAAVLGGRRAANDWAGQAGALLARARDWAADTLRAEADAARLAPWLAVGFGFGILLYFVAPAEPSIYAPAAALVVLVLIAWASRDRPFAFGLVLALISIAAGFGAGCLRGSLVAHPVLTRPTATVTLTGFVEARDATERSERIVLRLTGASGDRAMPVLERVRVALRRGFAPSVGQHVELRARLVPLLGPVRPGGYDYARGAYFARLGATGFVLGRPTAAPAPEIIPWEIRAYAAIESVRRALAHRIRTVLPGETGAVAAALVTGLRDAIPPEVNESMRVSGLYHVLSISGLHMALVAGVLFGLVRGGLALVPDFALRRPIKKWAAVAAIAGLTFYLLLSGAEVATQRSYIMILIVLIGVLVDRPALTLRTLAAAAAGTLAISPEALLNPGFQMSFAATLALVALFERLAPAIAQPPTGGGMFMRFVERAGRWVLLGVVSSLAAGLATTAYVAFHFHRVAPYGVLANLLGMSVMSFVVMPAGLGSVLLMPFGYDAVGWQVMGGGIELMLAIARWVAALPGAEGRVAAFGAGTLLMATAGILMLCLPSSRIRYAGAPLLLVAFVVAVNAPRPDVLVDAEGGVVAVRGADGRLTILDAGKSRITAEGWLAADADGRKARDDLAAGFRCDRFGCIARLQDGTVIAVARTHGALAEDCREAALIVTQLEVPAACAAARVDLRMLATAGAIGLRRVDGRWVAEPARSPRADRPWYGRRTPPDASALNALERREPAVRARSEPPDDRSDEEPMADAPDDADAAEE
jgi:competence protein ComEC